MALARILGEILKPPPATVPSDGRQGWFEGVREDKLCGWTYLPDNPERSLEVTLTSLGGAALTVRADRLRADLQAAGHGDGYCGFSAPVPALPGWEHGVDCGWRDLDLPLPGSPWSPARRAGTTFRAGPVVLTLDAPLAGDPRLTGKVLDRRAPFRRVRLRARPSPGDESCAVASLYRPGPPRRAGDAFHGFILALPAPLAMLSAGVEIFDADDDRLLAHVELKSL